MNNPCIEFYDYHSVDYEACLAIFDSNTPQFFSAEERQEFEAFLLDLPGPYLLLKHSEKGLIGCGGYAFNQADQSADLCWGIIHKDFHKQGFGQALLQERLARIQLNPDIKTIHLNTCQLTDGFFENSGFTTQTINKDGFGPGLDRHDMELLL
jgi:RimJ/RimL family protein N-acetyltransferase